jgi:hypothetical protein
MLERLQGKFLEPDGKEGTYQLKYYETQEGEIILGYSFSIPTVHRGVAVEPSQVLTFGDLKIYQRDGLRAMEPQEIYQAAGKVQARPLPMVDWLNVKPKRSIEPQADPEAGLPPFLSVELMDLSLIESLGAVAECWIDLAAQQYGSRDEMLEDLWMNDRDREANRSCYRTPRSAKAPYTKELVALERGFYASKSMHEGWRNALEAAAINQGVSETVAAKIATQFLEANFGIIIHLDE